MCWFFSIGSRARRWLVLPLTWWSATASAAQGPPRYRAEHMRADLATFTTALLLGHPALADREAAVAFDRFAARLAAEADTASSAVDFHLLVMRLTARLHDGHTRALVTGATGDYVRAQGLLPLHVLVRDERVFVLRNLSDARVADGSEILAINGIPSNAIIHRLAEYLGVDGASPTGTAYRLGSHYNSFYRVFPLVFGFRASYRLAIADARSGEVQEVAVAPVSGARFREAEVRRYGAPLHGQGLQDEIAHPPLRLEIDRAGGYAVLRIRRFFQAGFDEPASVYPGLIADAFRAIAEAQSAGLIVDLRGNGGGIGANAAQVVRFIADREFTPTSGMWFRGDDAYYRRITGDSLGLDDDFGLTPTGSGYAITRSDVIGELRPFAPALTDRFRGKVVVLIDGGTVSAAGMAAGLLQEYTRATFVGQEAGGYAGMSNGLRQLSVRGRRTDSGIDFPLAHSEFTVNPNRRARGVVPDHTVVSSVADVLRGHDPALQVAIALLR